MIRYGVIDVGSNSVRLMISNGQKTLYKLVNTTRLSEGMGALMVLNERAVDRTVSAVSSFVIHAKKEGANKIYIFATAAVRNAVNANVFTDAVRKITGIEVDVISGEQEAYFGRLGALGNDDGGIIDVGGASSEVTAVFNNKLIYSKSLNIGAVRIKDECAQDRLKAQEYIDSVIEHYGKLPKSKYFCIGGTATTLASVIMELEPYDPERVNGFNITENDLEKVVDKLYSLTVEQRKELKGLQPARAEVIAGGALLLLSIVKKIGLEQITVSERDNLEGYLEEKRRENE